MVMYFGLKHKSPEKKVVQSGGQKRHSGKEKNNINSLIQTTTSHPSCDEFQQI